MLNSSCVGCAVAGSFVVTEEALDGMMHLPEVIQRQIQLSTNPAENQLLRNEFYYEQVWIPTLSTTQGEKHRRLHLHVCHFLHDNRSKAE